MDEEDYDSDNDCIENGNIYNLWKDLHEYIRTTPLSSTLMAYDSYQLFEWFYEKISNIKVINENEQDSQIEPESKEIDEWVTK